MIFAATQLAAASYPRPLGGKNSLRKKGDYMREIKWGVIIFRAFGIYTLLTVVNSSGYVIYHILLTLSGAIQDPSDRLISLIYPVLLGILIILTIVFFNIKRMPFSTKNNAEEPPAILSFDL